MSHLHSLPANQSIGESDGDTMTAPNDEGSAGTNQDDVQVEEVMNRDAGS